MRTFVEYGLTSDEYRAKHGESLPDSSYTITYEGDEDLDKPISEVFPELVIKMTSIHRADGYPRNILDKDGNPVKNKEGVICTETVWGTQGYASYSVDLNGASVRDLLDKALAQLRTTIKIEEDVPDVVKASIPKAARKTTSGIKVSSLREQLKSAGLTDEQVEAVIAASRK